MNKIFKAYEMNAFATSNGFSPTSRGCPRGFAVIESCLAANEPALLCWCAENISYLDGEKNYSKAAFALTPKRLICSGKTGAGYSAETLPVSDVTGAAAGRRRLFARPEAIIYTKSGSIKFACADRDAAEALAENIGKVLFSGTD